jgi:hypothetical protein
MKIVWLWNKEVGTLLRYCFCFFLEGAEENKLENGKIVVLLVIAIQISPMERDAI